MIAIDAISTGDGVSLTAIIIILRADLFEASFGLEEFLVKQRVFDK